MKEAQNKLGRLKRVDLRDIWQTEAGDFTPWLAGEENISLLGDSIGIDLEVEAQEKNVGPFRADILCKDSATGHWVLIENQLEKTDHVHLGQLMTYAAGLSAVTVIWVAYRFTEEHRAALDWLNDITSDEFNFFGLEVELWRIGDSPIAPKFNVVSKPNDWTRSISDATKAIEAGDLTETKRLQLEYWTAFRDLLVKRGGPVRPVKPAPQHWASFSIGRSNFVLQPYANMRDKRIGVILALLGSEAKPHFHLLNSDKDELERVFGEPLRWREMPDNKESHISIRWDNVDPANKALWPEQHDWLYEKLQKFHATFSQRIKQLNADDYSRDDDIE